MTQPLSRRELVRTAAIAGATVPFLGRIPVPGQGTPQKKLGVALVGLGNLSTNQLAPALQKTSLCRLAGIVTGTPSKAALWRERYGIPERSVYSYDTMHRMADDREIDVVYVVTPNALHAPHTIAAAKAGKHVFCEKPMDVSSAQCQSMIAACRAAGRFLGVAYRCQFEPHHLECVRLAREQVFGPVRLIEASFGFPIGRRPQWRLDRALAGGGPMMDVGIYALQTARMLTGEEPVAVSAFETRTDREVFRDIEESMTFQLTFPSGVIAHCATTYKVPGLNRFRAFAERGSFGMEPAYNYGGNRGWRSDGQPLRFDQIDQFAAEMDDFAERILTGTPTRVPGEEGLRDLRIIEAAYRSVREGRALSLADR